MGVNPVTFLRTPRTDKSFEDTQNKPRDRPSLRVRRPHFRFLVQVINRRADRAAVFKRCRGESSAIARALGATENTHAGNAQLIERAGMRFLEFFAAKIRNPHTRRAPMPAPRSLVRRCRRAVDRRRPASACRRLDRGRYARARGAEHQATARRDSPSDRLAGHRPGRAGQPGRLGSRAAACCDVRANRRATEDATLLLKARSGNLSLRVPSPRAVRPNFRSLE